MSELHDIKAAKAERMRGHDEPMMESACWEYACPCHDDLDRAIAIAEAAQIEVRQAAMVGLTEGWSLQPLTQQARANIELLRERDEARAAVLVLRGAIEKSGWNNTSYGIAFKAMADTETYEQYR